MTNWVEAAMEKDPIILDVLEQLRTQLGTDAFVLADHWQTDLRAVGIASPHNLGVLIYISCCGEPPERFGYELELPPIPGSELEYRVAGRGFGVSFADLVTVTATHFKLAQKPDVSPHSHDRKHFVVNCQMNNVPQTTFTKDAFP
jgi:hypothetical protein